MASGAIPDEKISASSEYNKNRAASRGRLHLQPSGSKQGAWVAAADDVTPWLQIDLGSKHIRITRAATQGRTDYGNQWVKKYKLQYSNDGVKFYYYREHGQNADKVK